MRKVPHLNKTLGPLLREARKAHRGLSQEKAAAALGTDRSYISRMERGTLQPSLNVLLQAGQLYKIPASQILFQIETLLDLKPWEGGIPPPSDEA